MLMPPLCFLLYVRGLDAMLLVGGGFGTKNERKEFLSAVVLGLHGSASLLEEVWRWIGS